MPFKNLFPHLYKTDDDGTSSASSSTAGELKNKIYGDFKFPISYTKTYPIPPSVAADLELTQTTTSTAETTTKTAGGEKKDSDAAHEEREPIYNFLVSPKHVFASELVRELAAVGFTDDVDFLRDTQNILRSGGVVADSVADDAAAPPTPEEIVEIWREVKEDDAFLEKYGYMDWKILQPLNLSTPFLDFLTVYNILSPALSLLLPIFILIVPFFILKIRGVPITFQLYVEILRDVAKYHILGKTFTQIATNMSFDKFLYLLVSLFLYVMQTYQNTVCCIRFFRNIRKIRQSLHKYRDFVSAQIDAMENWSRTIREAGVTSAAYVAFSAETDKHRVVLARFLDELKDIDSSLLIGKMMRCFYLLHKDAEYEKSLQYAMGFHGYLAHLEGIKENIREGFVNYAEFLAGDEGEDPSECKGEDEDEGDAPAAEENDTATKKPEKKKRSTLTLKQFYYPALKSAAPVKNDAEFKHNFIITGPNASGKTTVLKATILNVLFTQQFGVGFYDSCSLIPYTHIHSYLNIPDTSARESLFQAETLRCKNILDCISGGAAAATEKARHFCIFDELFSGTNPVESTKTAQAFLLYLSRRWPNVTFMMTTHYTDICDFMENRAEGAVANYKMKTSEGEARGENAPKKSIEYLYLIESGISRVQGAVKVLRDMNYPDEILKECE